MTTKTWAEGLAERVTAEGTHTDIECSRCDEGYAEHVFWGWDESIESLCERHGWLAADNGEIICPDCQ